LKLAAKAILSAARGEISTETIISDKQSRNLVYHTIKRILDIAFALFVIIILWGVLLGAWLAVKLTSPGPGIFTQQRVGKRWTSLHLLQIQNHGLGDARSQHP
jgi:lipopolysaccharide/colanic/teichoic acid biosynthesis glycosyltransferase